MDAIAITAILALLILWPLLFMSTPMGRWAAPPALIGGKLPLVGAWEGGDGGRPTDNKQTIRKTMTISHDK